MTRRTYHKVATGALADALRDSEEASVRREAVVALLRIGSARGLPVVEAALDDEDWEVRACAAEMLTRLGGR